MDLIVPNKRYYESYVNAINEYREYSIDTYGFLDVTKYDIFKRINDFRTGNNLPDGYVRATYLWLIENNEFIGEISIRHDLTDSLMRFGGNIGYGVRYSQWNKGFGTKMLALALIYAKEVIGLDKVLITCNDNNYGSARVIEKNGGVLQDKIKNTVDGIDRLSRRYWIYL